MLTRTDGINEGEARKREGIALAGIGRTARIKAAQLALIEAALRRDDGTCTSDDIPADLATEYADGGGWVGGVIISLARAGIITRTGYTKSARPSRHGNEVKVWKLTDRPRAEAYRGELARWLEENPPPPPKDLYGEDAPLFASLAQKIGPAVAAAGPRSRSRDESNASKSIIPADGRQEGVGIEEF